MELQMPQAGSGYEVETERGAPPCFFFRARERSDVEPRLRGMYLDVSLQLDAGGGLAWTLEVPDRPGESWSISIAADDLPRLARGAAAGGCATFFRFDSGETLDLSRFSDGLAQDWTGRLARAVATVRAGDADGAEALLREVVAETPRVAAAHHLLGRCARARGAVRESMDCYRRAYRAATADGRLLPFAAGPLSDLAVAFKRLGDTERALQCFLRSLVLRPNHPEALLSFFSMFPTDQKLVLYGAARVLALGGHDGLVDDYLCNYATSLGADLSLLLPLAQRLARNVDLGRWPFAGDDFVRVESLERAIG